MRARVWLRPCQKLLRLRCSAPCHGGDAALLNDLGEVRLALADADAEELHREAAALARELGSPLEEARALAGLGRYERARGEPDLAAGLLQRALTPFTRIDAVERERVSRELDTLS